MALEKFANDIIAAKELLEKAKADYTAEALRLLDEGRLQEVKESSWKERYGQTGKKLYCECCGAVANNGVLFYYCPACGAKMRNGHTVTHYISSDEPTVKESALSEIPEKEDVKERTPEGIKRLSMCQQAIKDLKTNKLSVSDIKMILGLSSDQYYMIIKGEGVPKKKTLERIKAQYKDYFGKELEETKL